MNSYGDMTKTMQRAGSESKFVLRLQKGSFNDSEIVVLLGENGTGKTTFIRLLAGLIQADDGARVPEMRVSYKPQTVSPKFEGTVRQLLQKKIMESFMHPQFNTDVIKPLSIEGIIDQEVQHLSGGEIQRVALILALGAPAEIYLIDEPSACVVCSRALLLHCAPPSCRAMLFPLFLCRFIFVPLHLCAASLSLRITVLLWPFSALD
jgi:ATP-binding cassette subfamily E protein 1